VRPKHLAIELSRLVAHPQDNVRLEQYATEGDLAAFFVLAVDQLESVSGKTIVDLGSGNGILGIGCAILGAQKIILIEADDEVAKVAEANAAEIGQRYATEIDSITCHIGKDEAPEIDQCDIVIMNPPWGFQTSKADRPLLDYGFSLKPQSLYIIHSAKSTHLAKIGRSFGYEHEIVFESNFRLPAKYSFQTKKMGETNVMCWRFYLPGDDKLSEYTQ